MKSIVPLVLVVLGFAVIAAGVQVSAASPNTSSSPTYDITTLASKVASIRGTQGFYLRASALIEQEADSQDVGASPPYAPDPITPTYVLSSPLDGTSVSSPAVVVNQDPNAASQNEPAIAVDPGNPNRIVVGMNDYVSRTWSCTIDGTPCSALGDAYSGAYFSNDGGATWCCTPTDPAHLGTMIPGVQRLNGGIYDAGGDPSVAFDSAGHVFYAGLGFDRTAPPNTVTVNTGTFDSEGTLSWSAPTFINPTTAPSTLNDKEWIGVDSHVGSPFQDRVYVSWTRFLFNQISGRYVQSPIAFVYSKDGGATFSDPQLIVSNVLYDQGSRVIVGADGTVYANCHSSAVWSSSADGGATWSTPVPILTVLDASTRMADGYPVTQPNGNILNAPAARRVDSFWPAVAASPSGKVYLSAYAGDVVSPWRTCAAPATPVAVGRINCLALGPYINNTRLDYVVTNAITGTTKTVTPNPVNTRYHFGGGFIGDYTDLAVGSDDVFHAVWTDTNQQQSVTWWFGFEFVPTTVNQQDIVTAAGTL